MLFGLDLYVISLATVFLCYFSPIVTFERGLDHTPVPLDRRLSLGYFRLGHHGHRVV